MKESTIVAWVFVAAIVVTAMLMIAYGMDLNDPGFSHG